MASPTRGLPATAPRRTPRTGELKSGLSIQRFGWQGLQIESAGQVSKAVTQLR